MKNTDFGIYNTVNLYVKNILLFLKNIRLSQVISALQMTLFFQALNLRLRNMSMLINFHPFKTICNILKDFVFVAGPNLFHSCWEFSRAHWFFCSDSNLKKSCNNVFKRLIDQFKFFEARRTTKNFNERGNVR